MAITTKLIVNKADAYCSEPITLTSGMSGAEIEFEFSDEWTGLGRTAVFTSGSVTKYVILDSTNKCMIPAECLVTARQSIVVGVFGTDGDDIAIPTIYCALGLIEPGTSVTGSEPGAITQSLYNQVTALLTSTTTELGNVKEASIKSADATVNSSTGVPSVSVTYEWIDASDHSKGKKATFAFANLKGESGQLTAAYATIDSGVGTPSVDVTMSGTTITFAFHNLKGANGTDGSDGEDGEDGVSPTVTIIPITGGHRVTITDAIHPSGQAFDVMDGQSGASSWTEITGKPTTVSGYGITDAYTKTEVDTSLGGKITNPASKSNGQILTYNGTDWVAQNPSGGGTWGSITGTLSNQTDLNTVLTQQSSQIGNLNESIVIDGTATSNTKLEVDTSGSGTTKTVYETSEVYNKSEIQGIVSDAWSSSITYNVGDYCISGNTLYRCIAQNSNQQPPNATYWVSTKICDAKSFSITLSVTFVTYVGTITATQLGVDDCTKYNWYAFSGDWDKPVFLEGIASSDIRIRGWVISGINPMSIKLAENNTFNNVKIVGIKLW